MQRIESSTPPPRCPYGECSGVRVNAYEIMARAVEAGVVYGWNCAHGHTDTPGDDTIRSEIESAIMDEICGVFWFPPEPD